MPDVVHDCGDGVPLQHNRWLQQLGNLVCGERGVQPCPNGIISIQDGWHSVVNVAELGMSIHGDHRVCEEGLVLGEGGVGGRNGGHIGSGGRGTLYYLRYQSQMN